MKAASLLFLACSVLALVCIQPALAQPAHPASHVAQGGTVFNGNCSICHGMDGTGSPTGKSLNVPDLRSRKVQALSNAALMGYIREGKGSMPAFKGELTAPQIAEVTTYVRWLAHHKVNP